MNRVRASLGHYILDAEHRPVEAELMEWARWYQSADRSVATSELPGGIVVSTVFLGLDYGWMEGEPPQLFETLVFSDYGGGDMERYATWEEAEAGHQAMVARLAGKA